MSLRLIPPIALTAAVLAGCSGLTQSNDLGPVCMEQSAMARSGTVGEGEIRITCPSGFAGSPQEAAPAPVYANEYNRNADIYRAGFAGALAVSTAR